MGTRRTHILKITKRQLKFIRYIMRKASLENLTLTGHIEGRINRKKQ